ncbi:Uncharacterized conserved protein [Ceraceosorus bombacis]|uniref:Uncharacterized conserved protein n=1 Tax=Ceraceosorus bombacis TaxID=401625 RepID=A0A0P1B927_9BASI|nr:Uncharacterized conserved protein [Ceraceosorus bombacis]
MDAALQKALVDRVYDRRKAATLDLEKQVREALQRNDRSRINLIIQQLCALLSTPANNHARNGGLIGLAGIAIALGIQIAPYLEQIVPPVLACFGDPDSKIRYFACESFYNIAKVCKGEILMYFNEIFDALSKLAADSELSVKNGAELLDRLLKDIVCEAAPHYVSAHQDIALIRSRQDAAAGYAGGSAELEVAREKAALAAAEGIDVSSDESRNKVFSLARFVPLLAERMYVLSPFTRTYFVSWLMVLDSVPDLELVHHLPAFLDGLLKYLSDPNTDVRVATHNVLADFLRECKAAARAQLRLNPGTRSQAKQPVKFAQETLAKQGAAGRIAAEVEEGHNAERDEEEDEEEGDGALAVDDASEDVWLPVQSVSIDYAAIVQILVNHIAYPDEEIQATALQWISEFLLVVKDVVVPFTPRLIPAILPSIAHHSPAIQNAAQATNGNLFRVLQGLPMEDSSKASATASSSRQTMKSVQGDAKRERMATAGLTAPPSGKVLEPSSPSLTSTVIFPDNTTDTRSPQLSPSLKAQAFSLAAGDVDNEVGAFSALGIDASGSATGAEPSVEPFDLQATVNVLTVQLIDEHEETRVAALGWLLMLHQKAPHKILAMDDGTFPALLKTLSDPSEEVIRSDLRLLAQISSASSSNSNDAYFKSFMINLVSLFSTDRRLLETRGSLIIRQLCASLHTERIFRTLAEILERDEDLEFASVMITNMNMILITSPELADFRRRLKNLDSSRDGQQLFVSLYRSWCHNAVATFSLCLLAQAYEHASNLLQIFADLEITVGFLIQVDKLVQLLESPIFTSLRLQLLEPERHPYLFKCMYGLLMLLPQSSAFATLRNRLNAVSSLGFLHANAASSRSMQGSGSSATSANANSTSSASSSSSSASGQVAGTRSKLVASSNKEEIKWTELLTHFRKVQSRHEAARRAGQAGAAGADGSALVPGMAGIHLEGGSSSASSAPRSQIAAAAAGGLASNQQRRKASNGAAHLRNLNLSSAASNANSAGFAPPSAAAGGGGGRHSNHAPATNATNSSSSPSFFGLSLTGAAYNSANSPSSSGALGSGPANRPTSPLSARRSNAAPGTRVVSNAPAKR